MYFDQQSCSVCGSEVRLRPHDGSDGASDGPVGPADGVVGEADQTVDVRECTNASCASHDADGPTP